MQCSSDFTNGVQLFVVISKIPLRPDQHESGHAPAVLRGVAGADQAAQRVAHEGERLVELERADGRLERGDVVFEGVLAVLRRGRLAEAEDVHGDHAVTRHQQGNHVPERLGRRGDPVHEDDDGT
jgi:hypothetical protein